MSWWHHPRVADVAEVVRNKAIETGDAAWLERLDAWIDQLATAWGLTIGRSIPGGTEAHVVEAVTAEGRAAVLKLLVPRDGSNAAEEAAVLAACAGDGCVELLAFDEQRSALLLERLGASMFDLGLPVQERWRVLVGVAAEVWRPAPDGLELPDGRTKAEWLAAYIPDEWERLGRPCSAAAIDHAVRAARSRAAAHDPSRAVLCHGDVHQWNTLRAGNGWKLVDPDGLIAEPECDLGIIVREDPDELLAAGPWTVVRAMADVTGTDATAIWEWATAERVSTGLVATAIDLQPVGRRMLAAADYLAHH